MEGCATLDGAYCWLQCSVHMTQTVDDVDVVITVLVADVNAHWTVLCIQGHEVEGGYVHLLTPVLCVQLRGLGVFLVQSYYQHTHHI